MLLTLLVFSFIIVISIFLIKVPLVGKRREFVSGKYVNSIFAVFIPILITSLLVGLRNNVGVDYPVYKEIYETQISDNWVWSINHSGVDFLFTSIFVLLHKMNIPYYGMFIIMAFLPLSFFYAFFNRKRELIIPAIFFLYASGVFFWYMNIMRQGISFFIILFSIQYIIRGSFVKYIFWILIAAGFHLSALLFIPCYLLHYIHGSLCNRITAVFFYIATCLLAKRLINILLVIVTPFLTGDYIRYYNIIDSWEMSGGSGLGVLALHVSDIMMICMSTLCLSYYRKERFDIYYNIFLIGSFVSNVAGLNMVLSRIPFCFISMRVMVGAFAIWYLYRFWKITQLRYKIASIICVLCNLAYFTGNIINTDYSFVSL